MRFPRLFSRLIPQIASAIALIGSVLASEVKPLTKELMEEYMLDPAFYKKGTMVQDILIATSDKVADVTHLEAAYLFDHLMKLLRADVAQRIRDQKVLCILVAHNELTTDIPQYKSDLKGKELNFYNWRNRGFLDRKNDRYIVLFAEEDVMEYEGGMQLESILIHEFGHVIHGPGFDEELKKKWTATYEASMAQGRWKDGYAAQRFRRVEGDESVLLLDALTRAFPQRSAELLKACLDGGDILVNGKPTHSQVKVTGKDQVLIVFGGPKDCYASKNRGEFFAEGVQCWLNTNRTMDHDHNHIQTREQLKAYDPDLAKFCEELLGDGTWRFVSPRERAGVGHLADYDPGKAPTVTDSEEIRMAGLDYYDEYWKDYWQRLVDKHAPK
ncbi:MAG: hypothetical protein RL346_2011 [Verrucomicrobiota bacterium]